MWIPTGNKVTDIFNLTRNYNIPIVYLLQRPHNVLIN